ncbi:uncharacterized protein LOC127881325 isoform X1 [Dreissena polymorpha]|uniref:uncharacterized protein LOC127881325 isoform X1 n=1 Tax=Dreissena polymorpha TaxID=45954 RepID=UPI002264EA69|nr:uncharacterized protein LOC127881325 isoform X1 [Dreissena polymorpha]
MTLRRGTCHLCPARRHLSWLLLTGQSGLTRYRCSQSRANRQEADDAASRDLSSMPCSATPLVAIVDGSEWADKIQVHVIWKSTYMKMGGTSNPRNGNQEYARHMKPAIQINFSQWEISSLSFKTCCCISSFEWQGDSNHGQVRNSTLCNTT